MNFLKRAGAILMVVAIFASSCNKYADDFDQLNKKLDSLATTVAGVPQLTTDIAAIKSSITALQTAVAALPTATQQTAQFQAVATQLTGMTTQITSLDTQVKAIAATGTATATAVAKVQSDLTALASKIATDNAAILKGQADAMTKLNSMDVKIDGLATKMTAMQATMDALTVAVAKVQTGTDSNTAGIANLATKLDAQATEIAKIGADLTANSTAADKAAADAAAAVITSAANDASLLAGQSTILAKIADLNTAMALDAKTGTSTDTATSLTMQGLQLQLQAMTVQLNNILLNQVSPLTAVTIDNVTPQVGSVLTALPVTALGATTNCTYQWYVGGTAVAGATAKTYTVVIADLAKTVVVKATGTGNALSTEKSSPATAIVAPQSPVTGVTLNYGPGTLCVGAAQVGGLIGTYVSSTSSTSSVTPAGATVTYQWQSCPTVGGTYVNIAGATSSKYYPAASDATMFLRVGITGTGAYSGTVYSTPTAAVVYPTALTGIGALAGVPQVGTAFAAGAITPYVQPTSTGSPSQTSLGNKVIATYQWQSSVDATTWVDIAGATAATYTPASADLGLFLRVKAIGTNHAYGTVVSGASAAVVYPQAITAMAAPTGTLAYGSTLTVGATTPVTTAGVGATYQWQAGAVDIFGATGTTYALKASDVGKVITVVATGQNGFFGTVTSTATTAILMAPVTSAAFNTVAATNNVVINITGGTFAATPVIANFNFGGANAAALGGATVNRVSDTQVVLTMGGMAIATDNTVTVLPAGMATQAATVAAAANVVTPVVSATITPVAAGNTKLKLTLTGGGSFKPVMTIADLTITGFNISSLAGATFALSSSNSVCTITLAGANTFLDNTTTGTVTIPAASQMVQAVTVTGLTQ